MQLKILFSAIVIIIASLLLNISTVCAEENEVEDSTPSLKGRVIASPEYVLGAGDILEVFDYVTKDNEVQPQVIQEVPILPDGTATIVPVGQVRAEGLTLSDLNQIIRTELSKTIRHPRIFISVAKTRPADIYIIGAVVRPGHYSSDMPGAVYGLGGRSGKTISRPIMTVTDAIEQAGGIKSTANVRAISLYRKRTNEKILIDIWKLFYEGDTSEDITLQSGDVIHVPEVNNEEMLTSREQRELSRSTISPSFINVQVLGAVKTPGIFQLPPESDFIAALASAGGPLPEASNNVIIARINPDGSIKQIKLKMKKAVINATTEEERIKLHPEDMVYVKYSTLRKFANFATETSKGFVRSMSTAILFNLISD